MAVVKIEVGGVSVVTFDAENIGDLAERLSTLAEEIAFGDHDGQLTPLFDDETASSS